MADKNKPYHVGLGLGACLGGLVVALGVNIVNIQDPSKIIPNINTVDRNCIAPSRLEITCKDVDGNGKPETIVNISPRKYFTQSYADGSYILRVIDGKPVLSEYEVKSKSAEIIYK